MRGLIALAIGYLALAIFSQSAGLVGERAHASLMRRSRLPEGEESITAADLLFETRVSGNQQVRAVPVVFPCLVRVANEGKCTRCWRRCR